MAPCSAVVVRLKRAVVERSAGARVGWGAGFGAARDAVLASDRVARGAAHLAALLRASGTCATPVWRYAPLGEPDALALAVARAGGLRALDPFRSFVVSAPPGEARALARALAELSAIEAAFVSTGARAAGSDSPARDAMAGSGSTGCAPPDGAGDAPAAAAGAGVARGAPGVAPPAAEEAGVGRGAEPAPEQAGFAPAAGTSALVALLGLEALRALPGARGEGQRLLSLECGWALPHPALPPLAALTQLGDQAFADPHGTMSLGLLAASGPRGLGLAPAAALTLVGVGARPTHGDVAAGLLAAWLAVAGTPAARASAAGTVLHVGIQLDTWPGVGPDGAVDWPGSLPIDVDPEIRVVLDALASAGVVAVEPAGNNPTLDLDRWAFATTGSEAGPFAPLRGGGPIRVGGAAAGAEGFVVSGTAYAARRVHVYGPSRGVCTTAAGGGWTDSFGGSSSAVAIVAGLVVALQGVRAARGAPPLSAARLRRLFVRRNGTPVRASDGRVVGGIPDIARVLVDPEFAR